MWGENIKWFGKHLLYDVVYGGCTLHVFGEGTLPDYGGGSLSVYIGHIIIILLPSK